jgi:quinoprotein glucose dehydrogenase
MKQWVVFMLAASICSGCISNDEENKAIETGKDWPVYGGNKAGNRYSPLTQINLQNIKNLKIAWQYDARTQAIAVKPGRQRQIQCQPIVVNGILYGTTPDLNLFAVDGATGQQLWKFEPGKDEQGFNTNRGVMYWQQNDDKRIFYSAGAFLYAVNALTGKPVTGFGAGGKVDLHEGLAANQDHDINNLSVTATTPGVICKNILVMGSSVSENGDAAPGHIRGFDVLTGKLRWVFHTVPQPGEPGYETWPKDAYKKIGAANNWAGLVADEKRGSVYFGTGSPASDFYGGDREGANLYANCIISLDAGTGKLKWYYQTIHHDLWDRDIPCQPNLVTVKHNGKTVDAVAQATKDGFIYLLDRDNGNALFPVEEKQVPVQGLPGEHPFATQKFPAKPAPFSHQVFSDTDITNISAEAHAFVKERYQQYTGSDNKFTPPSAAGTLLFGYSGGAEWGGNAVDPQGILYLNENEDAWELKMIDRETRNKEIASLSPGHGLYLRNCAGCHGADRRGAGAVFPELLSIGNKRSAEQIDTVIKSGSGRMPSFQFLTEKDRRTIVNFLLNKEPNTVAKPLSEHSNAETIAAKKKDFPYDPLYTSRVWQKFTDQDGYNAVKPPWGTLNAIDLNTGDYLWRVPLGEFPELTKKGIPITGSESYGGPLVTASGLVFIAGTRDERIRAFDKKTGKIVWEYQLPAGGFATPITYEVKGRQYIAIAVGGGRGSNPGGWYIAFSL